MNNELWATLTRALIVGGLATCWAGCNPESSDDDADMQTQPVDMGDNESEDMPDPVDTGEDDEDMSDDVRDMDGDEDMMDMRDMRDEEDMTDMSDGEDMMDMSDMADMRDMSGGGGGGGEEGVNCSMSSSADEDSTRCMQCSSPPAVEAPDCDGSQSLSISNELSGGGSLSGANLRLGPDATLGGSVATDSYMIRELGQDPGSLRFRTSAGDDDTVSLRIEHQADAEAFAVKSRTCPASDQNPLRDASAYVIVAQCGNGLARVTPSLANKDLFEWKGMSWVKVDGEIAIGQPTVFAVRPSGGGSN